MTNWIIEKFSGSGGTRTHDLRVTSPLNFLSFPRKLTLRAKLVQKWFFWDFKVIPPDYVTINPNSSPIPRIYIPNTTILAEKNS